MESSLKRSIIRSVILFSVIFLALIGCAFFLINTYLPEFLQRHYISRSRELAQVISRTMQDHNLTDSYHETLVRRMVELNFPEERNFVHIVVRDRTGVPTFIEGDPSSVAEILEQRDGDGDSEEPVANEPSRISQVVRGDVTYYRITSPIVQSDVKIGEVVVGFSKKSITDRVELNRAQITNIVFSVSLTFIAILIIFFFGFMRLLLKYKHSEARMESFKRMAYVGEMTSGLAHEIRNPLNLMSINLQLMRESLGAGDYEKVQKKISLLESAKDHAARILTEFLGFARARMSEPEEFELSTLLDEVFALMKDEAHQRELVFTHECEPQHIKVRLDRIELRMILINLVMNAMDSYQQDTSNIVEKKVRISLIAKRRDILLTIEDSGCGMDEFTLQNLYTPFFSKKRGGTGLGLAVVRRIVQENGWSIDCVSLPQNGTTFTILLKEVVVS
jgi:signal transduction histidine kinase